MALSDDEYQQLAKEYEDACWEACSKCDRAGYDAGWWKSSLRAHGGVEASKGLIRRAQRDNRPQSGFLKLIEMGGDWPTLTVEYSVLWPKWRPLFEDAPDLLTTARLFLRQAGITPPDEQTA
jgi:hypothetical protein